MKYLFFFLLLLLPVYAQATEDLQLTNPIVIPSTTRWRVDEVHMYFSNPAVTVIYVDPDNSRTMQCVFTGQQAASIESQWNTSDFSKSSLQKSLISSSQQTGCLGPGTVTGTP